MESVLRGAAIYVVMLVIVRLSGRRTLAQMTPFDLVLLLIIAETTQQALLGDDFSLVNALVLMVTLFTLDIGLSYVKGWSPRFARMVEGGPTLLVANGVIDDHAMKRARVDRADIMSAARMNQGLERLDQIRFAVLEADGNLSIVPRPDER